MTRILEVESSTGRMHFNKNEFKDKKECYKFIELSKKYCPIKHWYIIVEDVEEVQYNEMMKQ